jgi:hypothetical protein
VLVLRSQVQTRCAHGSYSGVSGVLSPFDKYPMGVRHLTHTLGWGMGLFSGALLKGVLWGMPSVVVSVTRREYIPVGSAPASLPVTVTETTTEDMLEVRSEFHVVWVLIEVFGVG